MSRQGTFENSVIIGSDVWIGIGSRLMPGVRIGSGAIVAAGAVVTSDVELLSVVGGNPARAISKRPDDRRGSDVS